jgi:hypothetical protein
MNRKYTKAIPFFTLLLFFTIHFSSAQTDNVKAMASLELEDRGALEQFDMRTRGIDGSIYYHDAWSKANLVMPSGKVINDILALYNLNAQSLVISVERESVGELSSYFIASFELFRSPGVYGLIDTLKFVNMSSYAPDASSESGFYQILYEGEYTLLARYHIELLRPSYSPTLNVGKYDYTASRKVLYYMLHDDEIVEIPKSKGKVQKEMSKYGRFVSLVKKHKPNLKKEEELLGIFRVLNRSKA